jgi:hypothetical protein
MRKQIEAGLHAANILLRSGQKQDALQAYLATIQVADVFAARHEEARYEACMAVHSSGCVTDTQPWGEKPNCGTHTREKQEQGRVETSFYIRDTARVGMYGYSTSTPSCVSRAYSGCMRALMACGSSWGCLALTEHTRNRAMLDTLAHRHANGATDACVRGEVESEFFWRMCASYETQEYNMDIGSETSSPCLKGECNVANSIDCAVHIMGSSRVARHSSNGLNDIAHGYFEHKESSERKHVSDSAEHQNGMLARLIRTVKRAVKAIGDTQTCLISTYTTVSCTYAFLVRCGDDSETDNAPQVVIYSREEWAHVGEKVREFNTTRDNFRGKFMGGIEHGHSDCDGHDDHAHHTCTFDQSLAAVACALFIGRTMYA